MALLQHSRTPPQLDKHLLISELIDSPLDVVYSKWIVDRVPHAFQGDVDRYIDWKLRLSNEIGVDSQAIQVVGSAGVGVSLNPEKNMEEFHAGSDVDVAIISSHHFDIAWKWLRQIGPRIQSLQAIERNAIEDQRKRLIFYGTIATDKLIQVPPFGKEWIKAAESISHITPTRGRDVKFRIYRDVESLRSYQMIGLTHWRDEMLKRQKS